MHSLLLIVSSVIGLLFMLLAFSGIHIVRPGESGVIFIVGRLHCIKGPGIYWMSPLIFRIKKVDLRLITLNLPSQKVIMRNMETLSVTTSLSFRIVNPVVALMSVTDFVQVTKQVSLTSLHNALGQLELAELLRRHEQINKDLQTIINKRTESWGVKVTAMKIQEIHPLMD